MLCYLWHNGPSWSKTTSREEKTICCCSSCPIRTQSEESPTLRIVNTKRIGYRQNLSSPKSFMTLFVMIWLQSFQHLYTHVLFCPCRLSWKVTSSTSISRKVHTIHKVWWWVGPNIMVLRYFYTSGIFPIRILTTILYFLKAQRFNMIQATFWCSQKESVVLTIPSL